MSIELTNSPCIVIAGASGYIGKALIPKLLERFPTAKIVALSRSQQESDDPRIVWKACDLFSLKDLELAIPTQVDLAYYLVHSMGPTAAMDQGSFADYDLILVDNFARAIQATGLKHLIYLGGLIPETRRLSLHLQSRLEMEATFEQYRLPKTIFRAGLVLGEAGTSFQILLKIVKRLPVMICPKWTTKLTTPVDLATVLTALTTSALVEEHIGRVYDLAGCRPITYLQMMRDTAEHLGLKRSFVSLPVSLPLVSRLWVSLLTNTPRKLVYPLIDSLDHLMVAREGHLYGKNWPTQTYKDLLGAAALRAQSSRSLFAYRARRNTVRSVQRLALPIGRDAEWVKDQYLQWLPAFLAPFVYVNVCGSTIQFSLFRMKTILLELKLSEERSHADRQLLYIIKGLMVGDENRGRLEFRVVLNRHFVLAAIHDYSPSLPWFIYSYTQAWLHLLVMKSFARYLRR